MPPVSSPLYAITAERDLQRSKSPEDRHPFANLVGELATIYTTDHRRYTGEIVRVDGFHGLLELKRFLEPMTVWLTIATISAVEPARDEDIAIWALVDTTTEGER